MKDDLNKFKVEYLSNNLLYPTQNLSLDDQIILYKFFKWRRPPREDDLQLKMTSQYQKWNISATAYWIMLKF